MHVHPTCVHLHSSASIIPNSKVSEVWLISQGNKISCRLREIENLSNEEFSSIAQNFGTYLPASLLLIMFDFTLESEHDDKLNIKQATSQHISRDILQIDDGQQSLHFKHKPVNPSGSRRWGEEDLI